MSISPRLARVQHDPLVCGLDPQLCPGCAAASPPPPDEDRLEWELQIALGLPRRPRILDPTEQLEILQKWLDVLKAVRHRPDFRKRIKDLHRALVRTVEGV